MGSGKTTLADQLAARFHWRKASFGGYVRQVAKERGLEPSRTVLQNLGAQLTAEQGWQSFCSNTLDRVSFRPGESLVLDGIRHVNAVVTLRDLVKPSRFFCIGVEVPAASTYDRLRRRSGEDATPEHLAHSTEREVKDVLQLCDLRISGLRDENEVVSEVWSWAAEIVSRS